MLLALGMLIAPHAAAQPADASSSNVGRFYAFGGFAVFAPDKDGKIRAVAIRDDSDREMIAYRTEQ